MTLDSSLEMDFQQPSSYSSMKFRLVLAAIIVGLILAVFTGGYFTGRAATSQIVNANPSSRWQEEICVPGRRCPSSFSQSPVILLSLDGFAARYLDRHLTPSLEWIANCGCHPPFMNPVFPSKTFSNHYSIVTGLYPSSHGIIDNTMYDPQLNKTFKISLPEARNRSWWGGEPIWLTAKRQGIKTATYFWPGSDVDGMQADYYVRYNKANPFVDRVLKVLEWLDLPADQRPGFITLYFEEPDSSGHRYGPDSTQTDAALKRMDLIVDMLMRGLHSRGLIGCVNLVIVSDHGMTGTSCDRVVFLNEMVKNFSVNGMFFVHGSVGHLRPLTNFSDTDIVELKDKFQCKSPHVWAYDANDLPVRWLYFGHRRIDPIVFDLRDDFLINANVFRRSGYCDGGDHGYDNALRSMSANFIAAGPDFRINYTSDPFTNVEVYNLLTELLNVEPAPNNGTEGALSGMLRFARPVPIPQFVPNSFCSEMSDGFNGESDCPTFSSNWNSTFVNDDVWIRRTPWGLPVEAELSNAICILPNEKYVTGYSRKWKVPFWSMFNVDSLFDTEMRNGTKWHSDVRILSENAIPCSRFEDKDEVFQVPLVPAQFFDDVFIVSNAVSMYAGFYQGVLRSFWSKFIAWASSLPFLNVVIGPVWINGRSKTMIPSHYFIILTSVVDPECGDLSGCKLDTTGFVLPHRSHIPNCWNIDEYLNKHRSSVGHIELLTGLRFYTSLPQSESLRLRLKLVMLPQSAAFSLFL